MNLHISDMQIIYRRGGSSSDKSPIYDDVILNLNDQGQISNTEKQNIVAYLNKSLNSFTVNRFINGNLSEEQNHLFAIHNSTLERLEQLNEELISKSSEYRSNLDKNFDQKVSQVENEFKVAKKKLEDEYLGKSRLLSSKESALEDKLKAIDDRNNTHARREIRDKMLNDVKQRIGQFGVSTITESKRRPVLFGIYALIAVFFLLSFFTAIEIYQQKELHAETISFYSLALKSNPDESNANKLLVEANNLLANNNSQTEILLLWIRFAFFTFGLVGTFFYYIKWQNKWAEQHSSSEFQLQQFYIDVNRANWIIESCLEWRKETESAIPKELLSAITNNLFDMSEKNQEQVIHPADELASALLGSASKLKLKVGDSEMEFDSPKKLGQKTIKTPKQNKEDI